MIDLSLIAAGPLGAESFTPDEIGYFLKLNTPALVQDHLDTLPMNHETEDDTCLSALESTRQNCGHCIEGAMVGAYILSLHGHPPYLCDMRAWSVKTRNFVFKTRNFALKTRNFVLKTRNFVY